MANVATIDALIAQLATKGFGAGANAASPQIRNAIKRLKAVDGGGDSPGGTFLDDSRVNTKHLDSFSPDEVITAMDKHSDLIARLREGPVVMPKGTVTPQLMGALTLATSKEVGLWRLADGSRVLNLGSRASVGPPSGATRLIGHTHPSGVLKFSDQINASGKRVGDVAAFSRHFPKQRSSVLIGPSGAATRLKIPRL